MKCTIMHLSLVFTQDSIIEKSNIMISTIWTEHVHKDVNTATTVHTTVAIHDGIVYEKSTTYTNLFLSCVIDLDAICRENMVRRMYKIIMQISGSME